MIYKGKSLRSFGTFELEGEALVTNEPITLLGFVDTKKGIITEVSHPLYGKSITNKIFVFPRGVGSTVGPYTLINLVRNNKEPLAIINRESDQGTVAGCSVSRIPMVYDLDVDPTEVISSGDIVRISAEKSIATIELVKS